MYFWEFVKDQDLSFFWIAAAGGESVAERYNCEIAIHNDRIEPVYKYKGPVLSMDKKLEYVARTTLGMPLTKELVRRYRRGEPANVLKVNDEYPRLHFKITINENYPKLEFH
jgi:hypothetical protein